MKREAVNPISGSIGLTAEESVAENEEINMNRVRNKPAAGYPFTRRYTIV
jgi:hypothetical protein